MELLEWARSLDLLAIMYLLIALVVILYAIDFMLRRRRILTKGIAVKGKIVDFKESTGGFVVLQRKVPLVRFETMEGKTIESNYITTTTFSFLKKGMEVTVMYDKEKPTSFFMKEEYDSGVMPVVFLLVGCSFIVAGVLKFVF